MRLSIECKVKTVENLWGERVCSVGSQWKAGGNHVEGQWKAGGRAVEGRGRAVEASSIGP